VCEPANLEKAYQRARYAVYVKCGGSIWIASLQLPTGDCDLQPVSHILLFFGPVYWPSCFAQSKTLDF
jgi:hypothetical protein